MTSRTIYLRVLFKLKSKQRRLKLTSYELKGCKDRWHLMDAALRRYTRPLKIMDFVWEIEYWDLRSLNSVKSIFFLLMKWIKKTYLRSIPLCSLRKHPFLLALRRWGCFARRARSEWTDVFAVHPLCFGVCLSFYWFFWALLHNHCYPLHKTKEKLDLTLFRFRRSQPPSQGSLLPAPWGG